MHTRWKSYFDDENQFDGAVLNVSKIVYEVVELWYERMFIMLKGWKNEAFPWYRVWWRWNIGNEVCRCHFPITHFIYDGIFCTHISAKKNYVRPIFAAYTYFVGVPQWYKNHKEINEEIPRRNEWDVIVGKASCCITSKVVAIIKHQLIIIGIFIKFNYIKLVIDWCLSSIWLLDATYVDVIIMHTFAIMASSLSALN